MATHASLTIRHGPEGSGRNCVEIQSAKGRLLLDLGTVPPARVGSEVPAGDLPSREPVPAGVLLSQVQPDVWGVLRKGPAAAPVVMTKGISKLLMAGEAFEGGGWVPIESARERVLLPMAATRVGDMLVTAIPVDKTAYESNAFLIEGAGWRVLYTGELRCHGRKPDLLHELIVKAVPLQVDVLLVEDVPVLRGRGGIEDMASQLESQIEALVKDAPGLVLAAVSPLHVDRLVSLFRAIRKTERTLVVTPYAGLVLHMVQSQCGIPYPSRRENIRVFYPASFLRNAEDHGIRRAAARRFETDRISLADILAKPEQHALLFDPGMLGADFENVLPPRGVCLHTLIPDTLAQADWKNVQARLDGAGWKFEHLHAAGCILPEDLRHLIGELQPKRVISLQPKSLDWFQKAVSNTVPVQSGVPLDL